MKARHQQIIATLTVALALSAVLIGSAQAAERPDNQAGIRGMGSQNADVSDAFTRAAARAHALRPCGRTTAPESAARAPPPQPSPSPTSSSGPSCGTTHQPLGAQTTAPVSAAPAADSLTAHRSQRPRRQASNGPTQASAPRSGVRARPRPRRTGSSTGKPPPQPRRSSTDRSPRAKPRRRPTCAASANFRLAVPTRQRHRRLVTSRAGSTLRPLTDATRRTMKEQRFAAAKIANRMPRQTTCRSTRRLDVRSEGGSRVDLSSEYPQRDSNPCRRRERPVS